MAAFHVAALLVSAVVLPVAGAHDGAGGSAIQKVIELLEDCKMKVQRDLDAEAKEMEVYTTFCEDELKQKGYNIQTAEQTMADLTASIEDSNAQIAAASADIEALGQELAAKDREMMAATTTRNTNKGIFVEAEKQMVTSVEELNRAAATLKEQASFVQVDFLGRKLPPKGISQGLARDAALLTASVGRIVRAQDLDAGGSREQLQSFLQSAKEAFQQVQAARQGQAPDDSDDDLDADPMALAKSREQTQKASKAQVLADSDDGLNEDPMALATSRDQPALVQEAPKAAAFESQSDGIVKTVENMQEKAETTLSELRKNEMNQAQNFAMIEQGLNDEIEHAKDKLAKTQLLKGAAGQELGDSTGNFVEVKKSKIADEQYSATLQSECQQKAREWEERQRSAKEEMAAVTKAKEILTSGVKAFVQVAIHTSRGDEDIVEQGRRQKLMEIVQRIVQTSPSGKTGFALAQIASSAAAAPFDKIKGLIDDMLGKLMNEAEEEATHEAFCQDEMAKSKESQDELSTKVDKLQNRIDGVESSSAELTDSAKTLMGEIAEIDRAQAEATGQRNSEHEEYVTASADFRDSAAAVARAIEVLKNYYETALMQVASIRVRGAANKGAVRRAGQPEFGSAKGDAGHTIISVLEMAEEDFTALLAECESQEDEAARAFKVMSQENEIARASKEAEAKAKSNEVTTLRSQLAEHKEDHTSTQKELDAVNAYLDKLKPECESKAMSYKEVKTAREAEIAGLKEALGILGGGV